jgi:NRPS condensation-like uncharacterized protein
MEIYMQETKNEHKRKLTNIPPAGRFWFPLDNAAKIYPAIISDELPAVFRITAVLKDPVNIRSLLKAALRVEKRFPYYTVQLKQGFFWYYLEQQLSHIPVEVDSGLICRKFPKRTLLLRILVKDNRLSVEFSHILADGTGAFEFLKTLLITYSRECGRNIPHGYPYFRPEDAISKEEYEDAYKRYFKENIPGMVKKTKAFHLPFSLRRTPRFRMTVAILALDQIKEKAAAKGVSMTIYLVALYLYILQDIFEGLEGFQRIGKNKVIRIQVPINLRNIFPSRTMRNFSLFVMPEIDLRLGHYSFDELIKTVYHQMKLETDEKLINKNISRNVGSENKLYVRGIPLFLKSFILRMKYYSLGTKQYSGVLTNFGRADLPPAASEMIDHFIFIPPPPNKLLKMNCGVIGFEDKLVMSFGNITKSVLLEEKFIQFIKDQGITINFETGAKDHSNDEM